MKPSQTLTTLLLPPNPVGQADLYQDGIIHDGSTHVIFKYLHVGEFFMVSVGNTPLLTRYIFLTFWCFFLNLKCFIYINIPSAPVLPVVSFGVFSVPEPNPQPPKTTTAEKGAVSIRGPANPMDPSCCEIPQALCVLCSFATWIFWRLSTYLPPNFSPQK